MRTDPSQWRSVSMAVALAVVTAGCAGETETPYLERRAAFSTTLLKAGPAGFKPAKMYAEDDALPEGDTEEVRYRSGDLELRAWVFVPRSARVSKAPALVYLHPGLGGASARTIRDAKPFLDAGFVVMVPSFRGVGANPGQFELFMGEVDDASAAVRWLAERPYVDRARIYAFGWSGGGVLSSLLALMDDLPLRHTASGGGLVDASVFERIDGEGRLPFDRTDPEEVELRMLIGNIRWMRRKHFAYVGSADSRCASAIVAAQREMEGHESLLEIIMVPGDHGSSGAAGMDRYLDLVRGEIETE